MQGPPRPGQQRPDLWAQGSFSHNAMKATIAVIFLSLPEGQGAAISLLWRRWAGEHSRVSPKSPNPAAAPGNDAQESPLSASIAGTLVPGSLCLVFSRHWLRYRATKFTALPPTGVHPSLAQMLNFSCVFPGWFFLFVESGRHWSTKLYLYQASSTPLVD